MLHQFFPVALDLPPSSQEGQGGQGAQGIYTLFDLLASSVGVGKSRKDCPQMAQMGKKAKTGPPVLAIARIHHSTSFLIFNFLFPRRPSSSQDLYISFIFYLYNITQETFLGF